jgi:integrase
MAIHKLGDTDKLTPKKLAEIMSKPGRYADGGGLYLVVMAAGQGSWMVRFPHLGKDRWKSLGPADEVTPEAARAIHADMMKAKRTGGSPWAVLGVVTETKRSETAASVTFGSLIEPYLALNATKWKNGGVDGHEAGQYRKTLAGYLSPRLVAHVTSTDVQKHLEAYPPARAHKVRMRVMNLINYAVAKGYRADGENPARMEVMKHLVPAAPKSTPHKSLPVAEVPAFMARVMADGSAGAKALAFAVHTVARRDEARLAKWSEIKGNVWHIPGGLPLPGERTMKMSVAHEVPLSPQILELIGKPGKGLIFGELTEHALLKKVKEHGGDYTQHGMRTTFNVWAKKRGFPKYLREIGMAHAVGNATDQSYDHGDALTEERRPMMDAWSDYLLTAKGNPDET